MSPIPLGILAVSGAAPANSFDLITTTTLSSPAASVTFSGLSAYSDYKHLQIRYHAKNTGGSADFGIRLNGVTSGSYYYHWLFSDGSSLTTARDGNVDRIRMPQGIQSSFNSAAFAPGLIDILDFNTSGKTKTIKIFHGQVTDSFGRLYYRSGFNPSDTSALSSITLLVEANNIEIGSRFSLYGSKG